MPILSPHENEVSIEQKAMDRIILSNLIKTANLPAIIW